MFYLYLVFMFLFSELALQAFPEEPVWTEQWDEFSGKPVVVLWRGTHFLKEHFPSKISYEAYWKNQTVEEPIYAAATYKKTMIPLGTLPNERQKILLYNAATNIQSQIGALSCKGPISINTHTFETYRYAFQHLYSNDYDCFGKIVSEDVPSKYGTLVNGLTLRGNPFVSCSQSIIHGGKYGFGLKYYGEHTTVLAPKYDETGNPKNAFLGVLHGIVLDKEMVKETLPFSVPAHHGAGHITVNTHYTCNILTEEEVSLVGRVPPKAVVLEYPLTVPSFAGEYDGDYRERYGLTKLRFNKIKGVLTDEQTDVEVKEKKTKEMMEKILVSPTKDKKEYHKNTLHEKLNFQIKERLRNIDAEVCSIDLKGDLVRK